jgi:Na+-driven multidrug efflux pump
VAAGYTIGIRVLIFTLLPSWGLGAAAATLVGQNLGAKQPERAEKSVWRAAQFNSVFLGVVSVLYIAFAEQLVGIFTKEPTVVASGAACLRTLSYDYVLFAFGMVIVQAFNGAGDNKTPMTINLFVYWMFQLPLAYWLATQTSMGVHGVFWAIMIAEGLLAVIAVAVFRQGKWKQVQV